MARNRDAGRLKFNRIASSARISASVWRPRAGPRDRCCRPDGVVGCGAPAYGFETQPPPTWGGPLPPNSASQKASRNGRTRRILDVAIAAVDVPVLGKGVVCGRRFSSGILTNSTRERPCSQIKPTPTYCAQSPIYLTAQDKSAQLFVSAPRPWRHDGAGQLGRPASAIHIHCRSNGRVTEGWLRS
jgi:hypothetical protein